MASIEVFFEQDGKKYPIDKVQEVIKDRILQLVVSRVQEKLVQKVKEQLSNNNIKVEITIGISDEKIKATISGNTEVVHKLKEEK